MTHFSANVNRIALLRNSRDNGLPDLIACARIVLEAGADGITVHPRPDERHIRASDIAPLSALVREFPAREFNIEGNPHHNLVTIVERLVAGGQRPPDQVTLVPDALNVPTSNRGFAPGDEMIAVAPLIAKFKAMGSRVSVFIDADTSAARAAADAGADRVELYTEPYAHAMASVAARADTAASAHAVAPFIAAARAARAAGLAVNAGHDLNLVNLPLLLHEVAPDEVSIGHAFVADALLMGLAETTRAYCRLCHAG